MQERLFTGQVLFYSSCIRPGVSLHCNVNCQSRLIDVRNNSIGSINDFIKSFHPLLGRRERSASITALQQFSFLLSRHEAVRALCRFLLRLELYAIAESDFYNSSSPGKWVQMEQYLTYNLQFKTENKANIKFTTMWGF